MRYIELSVTLPPEAAAQAIGKTDPFATHNVAVFAEHGGVTVVIPNATGPYSQVVSTAIAESRGLLDTLIEGDIEVPVPWRVMVVDRELMETNLLSARDLLPVIPPTDDDGTAGASA